MTTCRPARSTPRLLLWMASRGTMSRIGWWCFCRSMRSSMGENVVAVEVHQSDPSSSDMSFDARLTVNP